MDNLFSIFIAIMPVFLAIIMTIIAMIETHLLIKDKKVKDFKLVYDILANNSPKICQLVLNFYKSKYHKQEDIIIRNMIFRKDWVHINGEQLGKIKDIQLFPDNDKTIKIYPATKRTSSQKKHLPYKSKTLEENLAIVCGNIYQDNPTYAITMCSCDTTNVAYF